MNPRQSTVPPVQAALLVPALRIAGPRPHTGTARAGLLCAAGAALLLAGASAAHGHGASRGLHLHLSPDPASPGQKVTVEVTAAEELEWVQVAFVDQPTIEKELDPPDRDTELILTVPEEARSGTLSCHAEARTTTGRTLRSSAVLRISEPDPVPPEHGLLPSLERIASQHGKKPQDR